MNIDAYAIMLGITIIVIHVPIESSPMGVDNKGRRHDNNNANNLWFWDAIYIIFYQDAGEAECIWAVQREKKMSSRKHAIIVLTPLNPIFIQ